VERPWSRQGHYGHLREVTRDDIHTIADALTGLARKRTLVALRSLFRFYKRHGRIFRDPTTHIRPGTPQRWPGRDEHAPQRVCPSTSAGPRSAR
jgi:site-specific recombinase XerD